jgi:putative ABC transport system substrate-binding protein
LIGTGPFFVSHRAEVTALAAKAKLPALYGIREFVLAGGLMSYGTDLANLYREMARLVDKIFKEPAQPTCRLSDQTNLSCS